MRVLREVNRRCSRKSALNPEVPKKDHFDFAFDPQRKIFSHYDLFQKLSISSSVFPFVSGKRVLVKRKPNAQIRA